MNEEVRAAWNNNAAFWDERMGEGNDFVEMLIWPATTRLLNLRPDERVLDIACGNGLTSRRMAALGADVVAFDIAEKMIAHALQRANEHAGRIAYHVLDATYEDAMLQLGEGQFDAALCSMALFDMSEIRPLMRSLARLLHPRGRFVFSVLHPCFNGPSIVQVAEQSEREGQPELTYAIKVNAYISTTVSRGIAIHDQPTLQPIFHRPLQELLGAGFAAGFVLDGLEEPVFPPEHRTGTTPLSWSGNFSEIPPVLVARMRLAG